MSKIKSAGFTLMEILIVIAILLLIIFLILINLKTQLLRANDTKRKADLLKIQKAFEEIYNDKQCYPASTIISTCNGDELSPYVKYVPCDPKTHAPYLYVIGTPSACSGYHLCAKLEDTHDPDIARIGCDGADGCGFGAGYNYCVAVGFAPTSGGTANNGGSGGGSGAPATTPIPGEYACSPAGVCNSYTNPTASGCPVSFADPNCMNGGVFLCDTPANRCPQ